MKVWALGRRSCLFCLGLLNGCLARAMGLSDAVLLVGHGTVTNLNDLPEFLLRIRRGRPPSPELIAEVRARYERVGGSPLLDITRRQAARLSERLARRVFVGMRMWSPTIEEALEVMSKKGVCRICVLPVAPFSVHVYCEATRKALIDREAATRPDMVCVEPWGSEPAFIEAHARLIGPHIAGKDPEATAVVLTAHSLPQKTIEAGDPYQEELEKTLRLVQRALGYPVQIAYQSEGAGGGAWLKPDLSSVLYRLKREGKREIVLAPVGFVADHVETLYDLDVEAAGWCKELGLGFVRVAALNDEPRLIDAMASVARRAFEVEERRV